MGKGSNTTTTNQNQTYAPAGGAQIQGALTQAQNAAQLPFNIPQAPVAGFSQDQQSAFGNINNAQGMAQPYINQAQQYFSPQGAQQFFNPYADAVTAQMQNIFGQQNQQNNANLTQAAGGVGADRIAVGQGNLARQQDLAAGQTLSNLWNSAVQQAQGAGYGTAALGSQAQNAALSGAQAQLASGGLQQQLAQAQLNAPYQQQLAQAAFPYQQAQFLAGITGSLAPGLGGTTTGQGQTTTPAPSIWSQILGLGTAGVGAAGTLGAFSGPSATDQYGGGSAAAGDAYGGSAAAPLPGLTAADYGKGAGGRVPMFARGGYAEGGVSDEPIDVSHLGIVPHEQLAAPQVHMPSLNLNPSAASQSGSGDAAKAVGDIAKMAMMFAKRGGMVNPKFAEGGETKDQSYYGQDQSSLGNQFSAFYREHWPDMGPSLKEQAQQTSSRSKKPIRSPFPGYAEGGSPLDDQAWPSGPVGGPTDRQNGMDMLRDAMLHHGYRPNADKDVINPDEPYRMPDAQAVADWEKSADRDRSLGLTAQPASAPAGATAAAAMPAMAPQGSPGEGGPALAPQQQGPGDPEPTAEDASSKFAKSPWMALMAAGLGMAGGTSPFAGVNIGQGALQGVKALEEQRGAAQKDTTIAQAARRLELEAKHHEDQYTRMTPYQQIEALKPVQV